MEIKLLPIALITIILLGGFASYLNTQQIVYASKDNINKIAVAQTIIDKISRRINYILSLAEEYNIEIPENLTDNTETAKELLANASAIVYDEPCKAIKMAIKASIVFAPIARYVASNLPEDVKSDLEKRRVECAVEARLRIVRKLKLVIERLENMSLPVPEAAVNAVDEAETILLNALEKIESGNYTVSEIAGMINSANKHISDAIKALHGDFKEIWKKASVADVALHLIGKLTYKLMDRINITIQLIEEGKVDDAKSNISIMIRFIDLAIARLEHCSYIYKHLPDNYTSVIEKIKDTLINVRDLLDDALESLDLNDTISAVSYLEDAVTAIQNTLEELSGVFHCAHHYLSHVIVFVSNVRVRFGEWIRKLAVNKLSNLIIKIGHIESHLNHAYRKYQNGELTKDEFKNILEHYKQTLLNILDALNRLEHPPKKLVNHINELLAWIEEVESTLES